ncbi:hypothetical protein ACFY4C_15840 [Actinomadura viridis]|uniref:hypothetical protein n=1 Tax=Actinomadura viridis TaxID=58110 RepID=UPI0036BBD4F9
MAGGRRAPAHIAVIAAAAGASLPFAAPPAQAAPAAPAPPSAQGGVRISYSAPETTGTGDRIAWRWRLRNTGDRAVNGVVLVHTVDPGFRVSSYGALCAARSGTLRCEYRSLRPGERREGTLVAHVPAGVSGRIQLQGRVIWQQRTRKGVSLRTTAPVRSSAPYDSGATSPREGIGAPHSAKAPERDEAPAPRPNGAPPPKGSETLVTR